MGSKYNSLTGQWEYKSYHDQYSRELGFQKFFGVFSKKIEPVFWNFIGEGSKKYPSPELSILNPPPSENDPLVERKLIEIINNLVNLLSKF